MCQAATLTAAASDSVGHTQVPSTNRPPVFLVKHPRFSADGEGALTPTGRESEWCKPGEVSPFFSPPIAPAMCNPRLASGWRRAVCRGISWKGVFLLRKIREKRFLFLVTYPVRPGWVAGLPSGLSSFTPAGRGRAPGPLTTRSCC